MRLSRRGFICLAGSFVALPITRVVALAASGPVTITANRQIIQNLRITATGSHNGITCDGFKGVTIRNCVIYHEDARGILFSNSPNITIQSTNIKKTNSPAKGTNTSAEHNNIEGYNSANPTIGGASAAQGNRVENGSSGVYLAGCGTPHVLYLEGHNMRGPFPRGQLCQFNASSGGELRHFSCINDLAVSWTEDNVNIYHSSNTAISDGVIDGNNSPSGDGVMVESGSNNCTVERVDVIHWGNGAFAAYTNALGTIFTNCRADIWHADGGRGAALSNGLTFTAADGSTGTSFDSSNIYGVNGSGNVIWDTTLMTKHAPVLHAFTARRLLSLPVPT